MEYTIQVFHTLFGQQSKLSLNVIVSQIEEANCYVIYIVFDRIIVKLAVHQVRQNISGSSNSSQIGLFMSELLALEYQQHIFDFSEA